jgi:hypothetical protein
MLSFGRLALEGADERCGVEIRQMNLSEGGDKTLEIEIIGVAGTQNAKARTRPVLGDDLRQTLTVRRI